GRGNHARHGGCVHIVPPFAMRADMWQENFHAVNDPHHVNGKRPVPVALPHRAYRATCTHTGIVANDMNLAERIKRRASRLLKRGALAHIAVHALRLDLSLAEFGNCRFKVLLIDVGQHDIHTSRAKGTRHGKADAACPARYKGGLSRKIFHHAATVSSIVSNSAKICAPFGVFERPSRMASRVCSREKSACVTACQCTIPSQMGSIRSLPFNVLPPTLVEM